MARSSSPHETPSHPEGASRQEKKKPTRRRKSASSPSAEPSQASRSTSPAQEPATPSVSQAPAARPKAAAASRAARPPAGPAAASEASDAAQPPAKARKSLKGKQAAVDPQIAKQRELLSHLPDLPSATSTAAAAATPKPPQSPDSSAHPVASVPDAPNASPAADVGAPIPSEAAMPADHDAGESEEAATSDQAAPKARKSVADARRSRPSEPRGKGRTKLRPLSIIMLIIAAVVVALVIAFAYVRWFLYDDAADIQGTWRIDAANATMVFTADEMKLLQGVVYDYEIDPWSKTLTFRFSNLEGQASYYFSDGGDKLVITEGDEQPNLFMQLGLMENPAVAADGPDDSVIVLSKLSDATDTEPQSLANNTTETADTLGAAIVDGQYDEEELN